MPRSSDSLRLLGTFQLHCHGKEMALGQPRLEELIALLAISPGEKIPRAQIAYALWPESSEKQARANVRNLLYKLKQVWPDMERSIIVKRTHVTWSGDADITVDVHRFQTLIAAAAPCDNTDDCIKLLTEAVDLYRGDFLPNCYAEWALNERERLHGEHAALLEQLVDTLLDQRRYDEALQRAKALQRLDPLRESAYRRLMRSYAALGDRAAALRVYHTCASTLQQELGVEPSPATEELYHQLLRHQEQVAAPDGPHALQRQHLVGRHEEWRDLQETWRRALRGEATCILLRGEAGIGKTRLAEEMIDWVQRQGQSAASSRSYAVEGALAHAPIAEWLRSPAIRPALEIIEDLWRVELARLLPELLTERPDLPPPGPMAESWQQQRFFQSIVHALQAAPAPLLLHLDDMQWSDAETLALLQYLLHGARGYRLLLVGGIRSEDAGSNQALAAFIEASRHASQLVELHLGPLSPQETAELAAQTSGQEIKPDEAEAFFATSEGHPLYLIESVRSGLTISRDGVAAPTNPSDIHGVADMPPRIYSLLSARLDQLSETARQVTSMAAVIGRAFDYEILHAAVSLDEMALIDALDELWQRRIIREQTGNSYDFSHDRIREVAYQEISRARLRVYHRQVAAALESVHGEDLDDVAGELATHQARAGNSTLAYHYYRRAADVALAQHALLHAEEMLNAALRYVDNDPAQRIELLQYQDRIFDRSLQFDRWENNLNEELALLDSMATPNLPLRVAYQLSRSRYWVENREGELGIDAAQQAVSLAEEIGNDRLLVSCYQVLGDALWRQARMREAVHTLGEMTFYVGRVGDRAAEGMALAAQARAGMFSGMPTDELFGRLTKALVIAAEQDDKELMANLYAKFAHARTTTAMGQFVQLEEELHRALELAQEMGDRVRESVAWSSMGRFYTNRGDYRRAAEALLATKEIEREQPILWRNWVTLAYLGALRMQSGRFDSARAKLAKACEQLGQLGSRHYEVEARCNFGLVHHLCGDHVQAGSELRFALALLDEYGDLRFEALALTRLGYALEAVGDLIEAGTCYGRGRDLHDQMGQHYYAKNALAGLARIAGLQGDDIIALAHADTIWATIGGKEMDATIETARTLRTCYTIFDDHDDPRADAVLAMAWEQLQRRVSTIDDPDCVEQFWQIEDHRFFRRIAEGH